jgi:drug/metabolite transporter (DMT)-like permease
VSRKSKGVSAMVLSSFSLVLGGVMLFLISIPLEGLHREPFPAVYYFSLGWLAFLSAAAFSIWFSLIQRPGVKVSELNVWKFLIPVSGAILSWIILVDEQPDIYSITGMLIIAASLLFLNFTKRK